MKANIKKDETSEFDKLERSKSMPNLWMDLTSREFGRKAECGPPVETEVLDEVLSKGKTIISRASRKRQNGKRQKVNLHEPIEVSFEAENEDASEMKADKQRSEIEDTAEKANNDGDTDGTALAQEFAAIPELDEVLSEGRKIISRISRG